MSSHHAIHTNDLEGDERWPRFGREAAGRGVRAALAFPLEVSGETLGGLNIYFTKRDAIDEAHMGMARLFAQQGAIAIYNHRLFNESETLARQLEEALVSRGVIDQAKGILMQAEGVTADEAFSMLRNLSQQRNIKVRDLAAQIVEKVQGDRGQADPDS